MHLAVGGPRARAAASRCPRGVRMPRHMVPSSSTWNVGSRGALAQDRERHRARRTARRAATRAPTPSRRQTMSEPSDTMAACSSLTSSPPPPPSAPPAPARPRSPRWPPRCAEAAPRGGADRHVLPVRRAAPAPHRARLAGPDRRCRPRRATGSLTVAEVHEAFEEIAGVSGAGSQARRDRARRRRCSARATADEQAYLRGLVTGELRQGALDGLMLEAVAVAADVPAAAVRRASMFAGSTLPVAAAALTGGVEALAEFGLRARPAGPADARVQRGRTSRRRWPRSATAAVAVDCKLDGIRIQVHKHDGRVRVFTRSLEEITDRVPEVVEAVAALPAHTLVLDGEAIALDARGPGPAVPGDRRPHGLARRRRRPCARRSRSRSYFFDLLHVDGEDLVDSPGARALRPARRRAAAGAGGARARSPPTRTRRDGCSPTSSRAGHEGVVVKSPRRAVRRRPARRRLGQGQAPAHPRPRGAGRRVGQRPAAGLAVQHPPRRPRPGDRRLRDARQDVQGHDRRDARLADRAVPRRSRPARTAHVVHVRPEQVVEIAFDGIQTLDPLPRRAWRCGSPGCCATATTRPPTRPTRSRRCGTWPA